MRGAHSRTVHTGGTPARIAALLVVLVGLGGWTAALAEIAPPSLLASLAAPPTPSPSPRPASVIRTPTLRATPTPAPTPEAAPEAEEEATPDATPTPEDELPTPTSTALPSATALPTATSLPAATRTLVNQYSVQPGDSLSSIAAQIDVDLDTIVRTNGLSLDAPLQVGQVLLVPRLPGVLHIVRADESLSGIAALYGVTISAIGEANNIADPSLISQGQRLFIPGAKAPLVASPIPLATATPPPTATAPPTAPPTASPLATPLAAPTARTTTATLAALTANPLRLTTAAVGVGPTATPAPAKGFAGANARLIWPLRGDVSQGFGENGHTGIDIMADMGVPIVAAADGVVIAVDGSDIGYGNRIEIDHGGGISSLYAHLSVMSVAMGQRVAQGQLIGLVGETGWATGPHLHFEVRMTGVPVNPLAYLP